MIRKHFRPQRLDDFKVTLDDHWLTSECPDRAHRVERCTHKVRNLRIQLIEASVSWNSQTKQISLSVKRSAVVWNLFVG
jgi:hypothetical protein